MIKKFVFSHGFIMKNKFLLLVLTTSFIFSTTCLAGLRIINPHLDKTVVNLKVVYFENKAYFSTRELAEQYNVRTYYRKETGKIVIYFKEAHIKVTANNTYCMFGMKMKHMLFPALQVKGDIYVPVYSFLNILKSDVYPRMKYILSPDQKRYVIAKYQDGIVEEKEFKPEPEKVLIISKIKYEEKKNGLVVRINVDHPVDESNISGFFKGSRWYYITIYGGTCDPSGITRYNPSASLLKTEAISHPKSVQLTFNFKRDFKSADINYDLTTRRIILCFNLPLSRDQITEIRNAKEKIAKAKSGWTIDTIVLDPGHGGKDPGAPGKGRYWHEKDIVLDISNRLGRLLESKSDIKVIYTRQTDKFIPLWRRTEIANKSGGKLFLSLHINACADRRVKGIEIYLLRPGKSEDAIRVAEKENSAIKFEEIADKEKYKGYEDFSKHILASMIHDASMAESENLGAIISRTIVKRVPQKCRGLRQAGFYVLVGASMPKLLLELGYNTNSEDVKKLNRGSHRQQLAEAIFASIMEFKRVTDMTVQNNQ